MHTPKRQRGYVRHINFFDKSLTTQASPIHPYKARALGISAGLKYEMITKERHENTEAAQNNIRVSHKTQVVDLGGTRRFALTRSSNSSRVACSVGRRALCRSLPVSWYILDERSATYIAKPSPHLVGSPIFRIFSESHSQPPIPVWQWPRVAYLLLGLARTGTCRYPRLPTLRQP